MINKTILIFVTDSLIALPYNGGSELLVWTLSESEGVSVSNIDPFESDNLVQGTFKRWSASAVECYLRQANCEGCYYQRFFSSRPYSCKMYLAVEQLLESIGEPSQNMKAKFS